MAEYTEICTDFWRDPIISEEMTVEDRYFYLYLLTNSHTNLIGIYPISKLRIAFELDYSLQSVEVLMKRFADHFKLIRYNPEYRELAVKDWGKLTFHEISKPVMESILSQLNEVQDPSHIRYVSESIQAPEILSLYESYL